MPVLLIAGLVVLVLGVILFFVWFGSIVIVIKATLPLAFIAGGAVAAYLGWEELREKRSPTVDFSSPDEASRYKAEARAYQEKINEINNGQTETVIIEAKVEPAAPTKEDSK